MSGGRSLVAVLIALLATAHAASAANLRAEYRFNDTLASSISGAPSMTDIETAGPNSFATEVVGGARKRVLTFPQGNGLQGSTAGVIPRDTYAIVVDFRFSAVDGYRRIIDFKDGTSDNGLYDQSGALVFYGGSSGSQTPITASQGGDPYHEVTLTRSSSGMVIGSVDGIEQFSFDDTGGDAVIHPGQTLRFFKDDNVFPGEESAGAVADIRLYDGPLLPPVLGKAVNVSPVSGQVLIKVGARFVPLTAGRQVPVGSQLDTRRGVVSLVSASAAKGKNYSGTFRGAIFKVTQDRRGPTKGLTTLSLLEGVVPGSPSHASCKQHRAANRSGHIAHAAARVLATLRARGHGHFRTRGSYSAGTVRGTVWDTIDRCDGTLTVVHAGTVVVTDFHRHKNITVHAGHSYLARAGR